MRTMLPMRQLVKGIYTNTFVSFSKPGLAAGSITTTHLDVKQNPDKLKQSEVFEYNAGCIVLATRDEYRPRTKHLAIKWHHFRGQVRTGAVKVTKVDTKLSWADIITKPLDQRTFETLRLMLMRW